MRRALLLAVIVPLMAFPDMSGAAPALIEKAMFRTAPSLGMKAAKHVAFAWVRRDVRNGWAHGYSRPNCRRLSRTRVRCDLTEYGLEDSYAPKTCRNEVVYPQEDCAKVTDSWPFTLYVARNARCTSLWVWNFERFNCWGASGQ